MKGYVELTAQRIIAALRNGQKHKRMLCRVLQCEYTHIDSTMTELLRRGEVVALGTAGQAGYRDIKSTAPVYGLPGMKLEAVPKPTTRRASNGSGKFAETITHGRGSVWGTGLA